MNKQKIAILVAFIISTFLSVFIFFIFKILFILIVMGCGAPNKSLFCENILLENFFWFLIFIIILVWIFLMKRFLSKIKK